MDILEHISIAVPVSCGHIVVPWFQARSLSNFPNQQNNLIIIKQYNVLKEISVHKKYTTHKFFEKGILFLAFFFESGYERFDFGYEKFNFGYEISLILCFAQSKGKMNSESMNRILIVY